jgi:hypothetical protein
LSAGPAPGAPRMSVPLPPLPDGRPHFDNVDIALAMARCEPLLRELERWLGEPMDASPVHAALPEAPGLTLALRDGDLAPAGTLCRLPWGALASRPAPPARLAARACWPALACELEVARYDDAPAARADLRAGRLLLLPQSFQDAWTVRLRDPLHGLALQAQLHPRRDGLRAPQRLHAFAETTACWRVLLDDALEVPADWALGWRQADADADPDAVPLPAAPRARLQGPDGGAPWARGVIVPALRGAALLIGDLEESAPFAPPA